MLWCEFSVDPIIFKALVSLHKLILPNTTWCKCCHLIRANGCSVVWPDLLLFHLESLGGQVDRLSRMHCSEAVQHAGCRATCRALPTHQAKTQAGRQHACRFCLLGHHTCISQLPKQRVFPLARLAGHVNVALRGAAEDICVGKTAMRRARGLLQDIAEGREHEHKQQVLQLGRHRREERGLQQREGNHS